MCGIAGFHIRNARTAFNPTKLACELLRAIDHRGGDATGYVAFGHDGAVQMQKASCDALKFTGACHELPENTRTVLLHTRFATQGLAAFPENNHPVVCGPIYAVHNGHIWNDRELFDNLDSPRFGEVDSEVIPAAIASHGWDNAADALELLDGTYAVAVANEQRPGEVLLAKGESSPLCYLVTDGLIVWASEWMAIREAWQYALGTPPKWTKANYLATGQMICIAGEEIEKRKFSPLVRPCYYSTATVKELTERVTGISPRLAAALSGKFSEEEEENEDSAVVDEGDFIRCGCCDEWFSYFSTKEAFGERICHSCVHDLSLDGIVV